jgi:hypothetical protein
LADVTDGTATARFVSLVQQFRQQELGWLVKMAGESQTVSEVIQLG